MIIDNRYALNRAGLKQSVKTTWNFFGIPINRVRIYELKNGFYSADAPQNKPQQSQFPNIKHIYKRFSHEKSYKLNLFQFSLDIFSDIFRGISI